MNIFNKLKNLIRKKTPGGADDRRLTEEEMQRAVFRLGEKFPLKGRWWVVSDLTLKSVVIVPVGPTRKAQG
ncbi:hypothetical protein FBR05_00370 [Deltaproteobacteria bacterium PRO3]|nr:hypothetical protein [Deltaproteobacteria bacterium PRO3]